MIVSKRTLMLGAVSVAALGIGAGLLVSRDEAQAAVTTGAAAPAFSVVDANGRTRTLSEFAGRTVVLEWTNNGCPYVRRHYGARTIQTLQHEAAGENIVWLTVISSAPGEQGYFDGAGALAHAQQVGAHPTAILLDPQGVMGRAYGARTTPHMFVINGQGRVVYQGALDDRPTANARQPVEGANNYVRAALEDVAANRAVRTAQTTPYGCDVKYRA